MRQADPRWSKLMLGFGPGTIGGQGCLLVCITEAVNRLVPETFVDPPTMNRMGQDAKAFSRYDKEADAWVVGEGDNLYVPKLCDVAGLVASNRVAGDVSDMRDFIVDALGDGSLVLLHVDKTGDDRGDHWVLGIMVDADGSIMYFDPATGDCGVLSSSTLTCTTLWGQRPKLYRVRGVRSLARRK